MKLKPGALIVLEGIDAAGKSTQHDILKGLFPDAYFTHQPSGASGLGQDIYKMTEGAEMNDRTRQLLHLAAHAQHYAEDIIPRIEAGVPVVMDRCWLSTLAYGWKVWKGMASEKVLWLVKLPTQGYIPDKVLFFLEEYKEDPHNSPELLEQYEALVGYTSGTVIPKGGLLDVTNRILIELYRADLVWLDEGEMLPLATPVIPVYSPPDTAPEPWWKFPPPPIPTPDPWHRSVQRCVGCSIELSPVMHYACPRFPCPSGLGGASFNSNIRP